MPTPDEFEEIEPDDDNVVSRESDEGYRIRIYTVSAIKERTEARTYTRSFGHYFVSPQTEATENLDEFLSEFTTENSVLTGFQRYVGDQYEVTAEVTDEITEKNYQFTGSREAYIEIPSHSSYVEDLDTFFSHIQEDVST